MLGYVARLVFPNRNVMVTRVWGVTEAGETS